MHQVCVQPIGVSFGSAGWCLSCCWALGRAIFFSAFSKHSCTVAVVPGIAGVPIFFTRGTISSIARSSSRHHGAQRYITGGPRSKTTYFDHRNRGVLLAFFDTVKRVSHGSTMTKSVNHNKKEDTWAIVRISYQRNHNQEFAQHPGLTHGITRASWSIRFS
jgi:hypothetical protein